MDFLGLLVEVPADEDGVAVVVDILKDEGDRGLGCLFGLEFVAVGEGEGAELLEETKTC